MHRRTLSATSLRERERANVSVSAPPGSRVVVPLPAGLALLDASAATEKRLLADSRGRATFGVVATHAGEYSADALRARRQTPHAGDETFCAERGLRVQIAPAPAYEQQRRRTSDAS